MNLLNYILVSGGATVIATQILKSKYIPIQFEKYPKETTFAVSVIAAIIAEYQAHVSFNWHNLPSLLSMFVGTILIAVLTYNHFVKK